MIETIAEVARRAPDAPSRWTGWFRMIETIVEVARRAPDAGRTLPG